jgi:hypothetical protein
MEKITKNPGRIFQPAHLAAFMAALLISFNLRADIPPLLDRELFFGDPEISGGQLSPDGEYLSFMRPYNGTRNLWVKTRTAGFDEAIPVTDRTDRPIPAISGRATANTFFL